MNFSNFYFNKPASLSQKDFKQIKIDEEMYDKLVEALNKDYRFVIESEEYKDDYGYGYKYLLKDGEGLICINKYKDEVVNTEAMIFCHEDVYNMIRQKYNT